MKKSKKKIVLPVTLHQHRDNFGRTFGAPHPVNAKHKNAKTQKFHDETIGK